MASDLPLTLRVYRRLSTAVPPLAGALIKHRLKRGKEDAARVGERKGCRAATRPQARWCGSTAPASARCWRWPAWSSACAR